MIVKSGGGDSREKFFGNYRGEVVNNQDPSNAGRCQIRVFSVYDGVRDAELPWAQYADPMMGGAVDVGGFNIPDIGNHVWVFFEGGDHMQPVYFAGAPARPHGPSEKTVGPDNHIFKTKKHLIEIDDTDGEERIYIEHSTGSSFLLDKDGNLFGQIVGFLDLSVTGDATVDIGGSADVDVAGNADVLVEGNADLQVDGNTTLTTTNFTVNASQTTFNSPVTINGATNITGVTNIVGNTSITGDGVVSGEMTISGIVFTAHDHQYTDDGVDMTTDPPNP